MGILNALSIRHGAAVTSAATTPQQIASPWSSSSLTRVAFPELTGLQYPTGNRAAAMAIPAAARARNLIVSTISRLPMHAYRGADRLPDAAQPAWLYSTGGPVHPSIRLAWTVDDLIWHGWSLWSRENNADGSIRQASRVNFDRWHLDADHRVNIDGLPVKADEVILFAGLHEGVLNYGSGALDDTRQLYANVRQRLANPVPALELHQTDGADLTDEQIDSLIDRWAAARRGENGGVAYTNKSLELNELGAGADSQLLIEARNAASLDLARLIGIAAGRIDATAPKASLNYETTAGRNHEFVDFDLALYMTPITARLSMDDVVPRGQRVALDLEDLTAPDPSPSGPDTQD